MFIPKWRIPRLPTLKLEPSDWLSAPVFGVQVAVALRPNHDPVLKLLLQLVFSYEVLLLLLDYQQGYFAVGVLEKV